LRLATLDPLPLLYNRGYVDDRFSIELSRAQRYGQSSPSPFWMWINSKSFNDTHGHAAGDSALRLRAPISPLNRSARATRGTLPVARFVVLMAETDIEAAHQKSSPSEPQSLLRRLICRRRHLNKHHHSAGLAEFPAEGSTEAELCNRRRRLFQAKRSGRNRVISAATVSVAQQRSTPSPQFSSARNLNTNKTKATPHLGGRIYSIPIARITCGGSRRTSGAPCGDLLSL